MGLYLKFGLYKILVYPWFGLFRVWVRQISLYLLVLCFILISVLSLIYICLLLTSPYLIVVLSFHVICCFKVLSKFFCKVIIIIICYVLNFIIKDNYCYCLVLLCQIRSYIRFYNFSYDHKNICSHIMLWHCHHRSVDRMVSMR